MLQQTTIPTCPTCNRRMTLLFFSAACDYCEGKTTSNYYCGYVIYREDLNAEEYVFRNEGDAKRWQQIMGLESFTIRKVHSENPFNWRHSRGSIKGLELADHLYQIYPDHRYEPGKYRAHVV